MSTTETSGEAESGECPVCGDTYNHRVDNGYRNYWPTGVKFEVCTTDDSDEMYVHTQELLVDESDPFEDDHYPTDCVLCGHESETPEGHEQHMREFHD